MLGETIVLSPVSLCAQTPNTVTQTPNTKNSPKTHGGCGNEGNHFDSEQNVYVHVAMKF